MPLRRFFVLLPIAILCACRGAAPGSLAATASDHWTRSYTLAADGELQIVAANGSVEVSGADGTTVSVDAERIARAATDASAKEVVPRIEIREEVSPGKVLIQTSGLGGIVIGVDVTVNYKVSMPRGAALRVRTANGPITVSGLRGRLVASSANGAIAARQVSGGMDARATNGNLDVDMESFAADPVELRSTNGNVALTLPRTTAASLLLNVTNGVIDTGDLPIEPFGEQTRRRMRGRLNAGGSPIEISTVNGGIRLRARP